MSNIASEIVSCASNLCARCAKRSQLHVAIVSYNFAPRVRDSELSRHAQVDDLA